MINWEIVYFHGDVMTCLQMYCIKDCCIHFGHTEDSKSELDLILSQVVYVVEGWLPQKCRINVLLKQVGLCGVTGCLQVL